MPVPKISVPVKPKGPRHRRTVALTASLAAGALAAALTGTAVPARAAGYPVVSGTIDVGPRQQGLLLNQSGTRLYIAHSGARPDQPGTVSVTDTTSNKTIATLTAGTGTNGLALDPSGRRVYVSNSVQGTVQVLDTATNTLGSGIQVGAGAGSLAINPANRNLYVADYDSGSLTVVDTLTGQVTGSVPAGANPGAVAVNPAGTRIFVTDFVNGGVSVIDTTTNAIVARIAARTGTNSLTLNAAGSELFVPDYLGGQISVVDTGTNSVVRTIPCGPHPFAATLDPSDRQLYVANDDAGTVSALDAATGARTATVAVGPFAHNLAVNSVGTNLYVENFGQQTVAVVALGPAKPLAFPDVAPDHPFTTEITWMAVARIATGYPDGSFRPGTAVNRDAMAAFLYRLAGSPDFAPPARSPFADVPPDHRFYAEITWLAAQGITQGYEDGLFHPERTVNRDAAAAFLYRLAGKPPIAASTPHFTDVPPDSLFYPEISWLASTGISTGYPGGEFRPASAVARDATAAFLYRYNSTILHRS